MSLLSKAKQAKILERTHLQITNEHVDLAIAYIKGQVTPNQVISAFGTHNIYTMIARALRKAYSDGRVKIK